MIDQRLAAFIHAQHMFFVATAPLDPDGHVNLSPKGLDTFRVLAPTSIAYLDLMGSGIETVAHLKDNGRIVFMFCAFQGPPRILRLYGRGEALEPGHPEFEALLREFPPTPGVRTVVRVILDRVAESCGKGVPRYLHESERTDLLDEYASGRPEDFREYQARENRHSVDGLPGMDLPEPGSE
ncbi:MAG: pyridoxamine 5'-phosphate oxidase [Phycisphaeraceae bacterium]|nr:pyridoxamine 5'-phosphate oxidase [Phycisphaeraceae bacterium]